MPLKNSTDMAPGRSSPPEPVTWKTYHEPGWDRDGLKLPCFDAGDDFDPAGYVAARCQGGCVLAGNRTGRVMRTTSCSGLFWFAKLLIIATSIPETSPANAKLSNHELIRPLVSDGFQGRACRCCPRTSR